MTRRGYRSRPSITRSASTPSTCKPSRSTSTSPAQEAASVGRIHHVSDLGPFQLLDAAATCDEAGRRLTLAIVNRERDRDLAATVDLGSATAGSTADVWEVNGPHVAATNSFEAPHAVDVRASRLDLRGSRFDYTFPAHSITLLHLPITR
ncbi:MAG: hypothetical protein DME08_00335 [Candidatus Rokuibacteriota bacterium]|nr:MAG: hypothetical protein DME08_00335 [Candidatus Rokubacteria bacterium]